MSSSLNSTEEVLEERRMIRVSLIFCLLASVYADSPDNATCIIYGDPHYSTFDQNTLTYEGFCKHLLVNTTDDAPNQFEIYLRNEKRDSFPVGLVRYVEVYYKGATIRLTRNITSNTYNMYVANGHPPLDMMANGFLVNTPISSNGMKVVFISPYLTLTTDFGLVVKYNGAQIVTVTIPSSFMSKVTGMCGNYDLNADNDLTTKDGESMAGQPDGDAKIGNSYVVSDPELTDNSVCETVDLHPLDTCNPQVKQLYNHTCSQLLDTTGPLKDCIALAGLQRAAQFYRSCMFDACATSIYSQMCRIFNAFLQLCPGVLMTADLSVKIGCTVGNCIVTGDPHYFTFDYALINYQGTCKHLLINSTDPSLPQFSVYLRNEKRTSPDVSYVKYFEFVFNDVTYRIWRKSSTQVDVYKATGPFPHNMNAVGVQLSLPVNEDNIQIAWSGGYMSITTPYGLLAQYDGQHTVKFTVPFVYMGKVHGMCGNEDLNLINDLTTNDGENVTGLPNFQSMIGNSYVIQNDPEVDSSSSCETVDVDIDPVANCDSQLKKDFDKRCSEITNKTGVLSPCSTALGTYRSRLYYQNCLYDACATSSPLSICSTYEAFIQVSGQVVKGWSVALGCAGTAGSTETTKTGTITTIPPV